MRRPEGMARAPPDGYRRRRRLKEQPLLSMPPGVDMLAAPTLPLDPAVLVLFRALREHQLLADVQVLSVCGEPDVRLVACREGGDVAVELLASPAGDPAPDRWHAVQVHGEDRRVWEGPAHDAPRGEVIHFLQTLLAGGTPRLPCHPLS
jgi:hypothetical protein